MTKKEHKLKKLVVLLMMSAMVSGCAVLQSVSTTSIPPERGQKVKSERSRFIFLAFNFNNDYVDEMAADLANQCPGGKVQGILTKHESIVYFPILFHTKKVTAEGFCVGRGRS